MCYVESENQRDSARRRAGVFIPWSVLVAVSIMMVATAATVVTMLVPTIGLPVAVGVTVAGFLFSTWTWTQRPGRDGGLR
jgi:hypothetical protein